MRQRIKSIETQNGIKPVETKEIKDLFFLGKVRAVKVTTSGTRDEIQGKFRKRMAVERKKAARHYSELMRMVREDGVKTKYFAA